MATRPTARQIDAAAMTADAAAGSARRGAMRITAPRTAAAARLKPNSVRTRDNHSLKHTACNPKYAVNPRHHADHQAGEQAPAVPVIVLVKQPTQVSENGKVAEKLENELA